MKIRARLTLLFTLITATILLAFATVIYYTTRDSREKEFYTALRKEAITKANLLFNAKVDQATLQEIYRRNRELLNEVEVAIYDAQFNLVYHDAIDIDLVKEDQLMINKIIKQGEISFYQDDWQVIGLRQEFQGEAFIITATAYDQYGYNKLDSLFTTLIVVFILSILIIYLAGHFFTKRAFQPIRQMIGQAAHISARSLDLRLPDSGNQDELSELANTFNEMLNRLEKSFDTQKHFVSNISHELRTPLAAIIAELELATYSKKSTEEYKAAIHKTLDDAKKLVRLSNSLLDLAKASYDPTEISFKVIRIDETLLAARQQVQQINPDYKVVIRFEDEFLLHQHQGPAAINGNEYLLKAAFINLLENGCKFSADRRCTVVISGTVGQISLEFSDTGIGIPEQDLKNIFTPFYRGENQAFASGQGIGLPLTRKIITLHQGKISVASQTGQGSTFTVSLPLIDPF